MDPQPASTERIGYLIPEFPGQTHIWMWREIVHMREWNVNVSLFSTRRPSSEVRARHAFAESAAVETFYIWPQKASVLVKALVWGLFCRPIGLLRCLGLGLTLPTNISSLKTVLPLALPALVLAREARRLGITRLHSHSCANAAVLCMMVKRLIGLPYSMTLNANIEWWGGAMEQKFIEADFTIAITNWLLAQMKRDYPLLRSDQAILGRIGVDTRHWIPAAPSRPLEGTIRGITVGRLHSAKGHDVLIKAIKLLAEEGVDVHWRIAGSGPEREALEAQIGQSGLNHRIRLLGSLSEDQIIEEMRSADVFALASHAEPLGVVYMEAMAMGVATIGTSAGGVAEIIDHGKTGWLIPPNDVDALARAIRSLMTDPALRHQLAREGRKSIEQSFDSRIGASSLYRRIFKKDPPALTDG